MGMRSNPTFIHAKIRKIPKKQLKSLFTRRLSSIFEKNLPLRFYFFKNQFKKSKKKFYKQAKKSKKSKKTNPTQEGVTNPTQEVVTNPTQEVVTNPTQEVVT